MQFAGTADPGRGAAAWTVLATVAAPGGAAGTVSTSVDCANTAVDRFVATRILYADGATGQVVSPSTRIECNPAMAEPPSNFKIIDRKGGSKREPTIN